MSSVVHAFDYDALPLSEWSIHVDRGVEYIFDDGVVVGAGDDGEVHAGAVVEDEGVEGADSGWSDWSMERDTYAPRP